MKEYNVIKAETQKGIIIHEIDNVNGEPEKRMYSSIRAGLSWPVKGSPGYYCILGEEYVEPNIFTKKQPRGKLIFFKELKASQPFLDVFFLPLTDDCVLYLCDKVYTDLREEHDDDAQYYRDYKYKKNIGTGNLEEAPYLSNFNLGISIIRSWMDEGLLIIPKDSIAYDQLAQIGTLDLESHPEINFWAINALRFVIGSFYKSPPSFDKPWQPRRRKPSSF